MAKVRRALTRRARALRSNPTEAEKRLWRLLRCESMAGWHFRRQHPVDPCILDFACISARLAVEADGGQHDGSRHDRVRDAFLEAAGWRVLRFWNNEILENGEGVLSRILQILRERGLHPGPPPARLGEGEE